MLLGAFLFFPSSRWLVLLLPLFDRSFCNGDYFLLGATVHLADVCTTYEDNEMGSFPGCPQHPAAAGLLQYMNLNFSHYSLSPSWLGGVGDVYSSTLRIFV